MRKLSFVLLTSILMLTSCASVPITGRKQMMLVSNQEVLSLSFQQYGEYMKSAQVSKDVRKTQLVERVGRDIANAVEEYLKQNGFEEELAAYSWEFNLVADQAVNAMCMPGGKIVVFEGILPYTQDETGLAVVLGHEVAHAVAKHANERMSQQMAAQYGSTALDLALSKKSAGLRQAASTAFGLGAQYGVLLPYSRKQELEADRLGVVFMAMAGYDPSQAASFWMRMSEKSGEGVSEFTSTHPSDNTRINEINKHLPEALKYYKAASPNISGGKGTNKKDTTTSKDWVF